MVMVIGDDVVMGLPFAFAREKEMRVANCESPFGHVEPILLADLPKFCLSSNISIVRNLLLHSRNDKSVMVDSQHLLPCVLLMRARIISMSLL